jgi:hypothetical protein
MSAFAVALAVGITMIFGGFLVAATPLVAPGADRQLSTSVPAAAGADGPAAGGGDGPAGTPRLTARTG